MSEQSRRKQVTSNLYFKVTDILRASGQLGQTFVVQNAQPRNVDPDLRLLAPLSGEIKFIKSGGNIVVLGTLETVLELSCTRCLEPLRVPVSLEIEETFLPTIDLATGSKITRPPDEEADEAVLIDEQHIINLNEVVRQTLHLCQPTQVTCEEIKQEACQKVDLGDEIRFEPKVDVQENKEPIDGRWAELLAIKDTLIGLTQKSEDPPLIPPI